MQNGGKPSLLVDSIVYSSLYGSIVKVYLREDSKMVISNLMKGKQFSHMMIQRNSFNTPLHTSVFRVSAKLLANIKITILNLVWK